MAIPLLGNYFQSTLAGTLTSVATTATLASTAGFVVPGSNQFGIVRVDDINAAGGYNQITGPFEIMYVGTNTIGTNTLSGLTRNQEGTAAHAFAAGSVWSQNVTKSIFALIPVKFDEQTPSGVSSITIPAAGTIPGGYRAIRIYWKARASDAVTAEALNMRFNGDAGTNYNSQTLVASNASFTGTASALNVTVAKIGTITAASVAAGIFDSGWVEISGYADTTQTKNYETSQFRNDNLVGLEQNFGDWTNTSSAITSITILAGSGNFVAGTFFATYLIP